MIILRQKIFFDYSKYTSEEAERIRAERNSMASRLSHSHRSHNRQLQESQSGIHRAYDAMIMSESDENKRAQLKIQRDRELNRAMETRNRNHSLSLGDINREKEVKMNAILQKDKPIQHHKDFNNGKNIKSGSNIGQFVKNNKVGLGIGAAAVGTGAYLLHRRNKKKREEEAKKNK